MSYPKLHTATPPEHQYTLFYATRPLPGIQVGTCHGMVFDVAPENWKQAQELDGHPIMVVTEGEYTNLVEAAMAANPDRHYSRADYEAVGAWDPIEVGRSLGMALITIKPL